MRNLLWQTKVDRKHREQAWSKQLGGGLQPPNHQTSVMLLLSITTMAMRGPSYSHSASCRCFFPIEDSHTHAEHDSDVCGHQKEGIADSVVQVTLSLCLYVN